MSTTTYYCHNCEQRRQIVWQPTRACALCGSNIIDRIPLVEEEEENDELDFHTELDFFFNHLEPEEEDDEEELEERCLFEQLSSMYSHPMAMGLNMQRSAPSSSTTRTTIRSQREDNRVSYGIRLESRAVDESATSTDSSSWRLLSDVVANNIEETSSSATTASNNTYEFSLARFGRLIDSLYNSRSDEESEDSDNNAHRSFLDSLADILSDYTDAERRNRGIRRRNVSTKKASSILSSLKKACLEPNDPDTKEECIICQEEFGIELEVYHLPCQHKYHGPCISKWFTVNTSCPICRHPADREKNDEQQQEEEEGRDLVSSNSSSDDEDDDEEEQPIRRIEQLNDEMEVLFSSLEDDDMEEDAIHEFERSLSSFMNSTTRLYDDTRRIQNSSMEEVD